MTEVLIDSYFWLGAINSRDPYHTQILQTPKPSRGVTTHAVVLEVMDALCSPRLRETAAPFWKHVYADTDLVIRAFGRRPPKPCRRHLRTAP